jgi:hypothetical protein
MLEASRVRTAALVVAFLALASLACGGGGDGDGDGGGGSYVFIPGATATSGAPAPSTGTAPSATITQSGSGGSLQYQVKFTPVVNVTNNYFVEIYIQQVNVTFKVPVTPAEVAQGQKTVTLASTPPSSHGCVIPEGSFSGSCGPGCSCAAATGQVGGEIYLRNNAGGRSAGWPFNFTIQPTGGGVNTGNDYCQSVTLCANTTVTSCANTSGCYYVVNSQRYNCAPGCDCLAAALTIAASVCQ